MYDRLYVITFLGRGQAGRGHIEEITKCVVDKSVLSLAIEENIKPSVFERKKKNNAVSVTYEETRRVT